MLGRDLDDTDDAAAVDVTVEGDQDERPCVPVMPARPPFPSFESRPHLPKQATGGSGDEGRDADG